MSIEKAGECLRRGKSFLIASHTNIDGDGAGAELAMLLLLRSLGKKAAIVNEQPLPPSLRFLPGHAFVGGLRSHAGFDFDVFVALDCSDLSRTGRVKERLSGQQVLNVDHHISNSFFGGVNWVSPGSCCCCEMVYELYKKMSVDIGRNAAACLYTGILMDTGSFRFNNTTPRTHLIAADLLSKGLKAADIYTHAYGSIPYEDMKILLNVLPTMKRERRGKLIWFQLDRKLAGAKLSSSSFDVGESVLAYGRSVKGVEVVILFKENPGRGEVRINFRSQGRFDVNRIASLFGGGGHKTAAGATVAGDMETVKKKVLRVLRAAVR